MSLVRYSLFIEHINVLFPSRSKRRTQRKNYMLVFHRSRLREKSMPSLQFPSLNGKLILVIESLSQLSPAYNSTLHGGRRTALGT